jgi:flagellar protein FliO/FliZ
MMRGVTVLMLAGCVLAGSAWAADAAPAPAPAPAAVPAAAPVTTPVPAAAVPAPAAATATAPVAAPRALPGRPDTVPSTPGYNPSPAAGGLLQTIFALMLVLGLLFGLAWVMKRFGPRMQSGQAGLRIVGALNLGGRERIMVVEVGDQWIVVGASPGRINALATIPKQEGVPLEARLEGHAPAASSFGEWLKQTIEKRNGK